MRKLDSLRTQPSVKVIELLYAVLLTELSLSLVRQKTRRPLDEIPPGHNWSETPGHYRSTYSKESSNRQDQP